MHNLSADPCRARLGTPGPKHPPVSSIRIHARILRQEEGCHVVCYCLGCGARAYGVAVCAALVMIPWRLHKTNAARTAQQVWFFCADLFVTGNGHYVDACVDHLQLQHASQCPHPDVLKLLCVTTLHVFHYV